MGVQKEAVHETDRQDSTQEQPRRQRRGESYPGPVVVDAVVPETDTHDNFSSLILSGSVLSRVPLLADLFDFYMYNRAKGQKTLVAARPLPPTLGN